MRWYEVWSDESYREPSFLILAKTEEDVFVVKDPKENHKMVFLTGEYEKAKSRLTEEGYILVTGRMDTQSKGTG